MSELPIRVKVQESASQVVYTDAVLINGNPLGFVLNFGQWAPEEPGLVRVYTRVGMAQTTSSCSHSCWLKTSPHTRRSSAR